LHWIQWPTAMRWIVFLLSIL